MHHLSDVYLFTLSPTSHSHHSFARHSMHIYAQTVSQSQDITRKQLHVRVCGRDSGLGGGGGREKERGGGKRNERQCAPTHNYDRFHPEPLKP